jgi:glycosyltransferase involved in cell wall biosynthesis
MRVVVNLRDQVWQTTKSLGILNVSTRLLPGLLASPRISELHVLANSSLGAFLRSLPNDRRLRIHGGESTPHRGWRRLWWDNLGLARESDRIRPDWVLLPKGFGPLLRWPESRVSAYVHDNIFGHYRRHGGAPFPAGESALFQMMLRKTARRAAAIVTNSNFTAKEFARDFCPRASPVRIGAPVGITSPGVCIPGKHSTGSPVIIVPTSRWPHKLTNQAIAWLQRWVETSGATPYFHGYGSLPSADAWPRRPGWEHHGRISEPELNRLRNDTDVMVYFSDYEGYGLPPVEEAAAGRKAIASDLPPLRETLPAHALFSNASFEDFSTKLSRALAGPAPVPLQTDTATAVADRWLQALDESDQSSPPRHE